MSVLRSLSQPAMTAASSITGGATGIGATLVETFAAQGARVGFVDIDATQGEALAARLASAGGGTAVRSRPT